MVNESSRLDISSDSAVYEMHENNITQKYQLLYTKEELDQIAKAFYENRFDKLKPTETPVVYDAPSTHVQMCMGTECFNQGNSATETYTGRDQKRLNAIIDVLLQTANKKLEAIKIPLTVIIDEALLNGKEDVHYQMTGNISFSTDYNGRNDRAEYMVLPGEIEIYANTYGKDSTGRTVYLQNVNKTFDTKEGNVMVISKKKDLLDIELKKQ